MESAVAELLTDLARLDVHLEAHGDRLRYRPRAAVTPDLVERLKAHKGELLAVLNGSLADSPDADSLDADGWPFDCIEPEYACPACGSLAAWQDCYGAWHCQRCEADALVRSRRLAELRFKVQGPQPRL